MPERVERPVLACLPARTRGPINNLFKRFNSSFETIRLAVMMYVRYLLLLRDVVGLSYTEIADSLEITLATVKWRIYKAREDVQLALAREGITFGADEPVEKVESL